MTTFRFGGVELESFGRVTEVDDYVDMPDKRGRDITVPFLDGELHVDKFYGPRIITLGITTSTLSPSALESTLDTMKVLFSSRTQQTFEKTMNNGTVQTALASINRRLNPVFSSPTVVKVAVEFKMPDPFFRLSTAIADNTLTIDSSPKAMTVNNTGNTQERNPTIIIDGPFTSITLTNSTTGAVLTYTGTIGAAETVTIGRLNGEFYATLSAGSVDVIGNVTHSGANGALMAFNPGNNTLSITSAGGNNTGTVRVNFFPPFL